MKKLVMMLCLCVGICAPAFCQTGDPNVYRGELGVKQVIKVMENNQFLPLLINNFRAFSSQAAKNKAVKFAEDQVKAHSTYQSNYNAAIVWASDADFAGDDDFGNSMLTAKEAQKAIQYATAAIEKARQSNYNKAPYMYIVRGYVQMGQCGYYDPYGKFYIQNERLAQKALKDFQQAKKLNPNTIPYSQYINPLKAGLAEFQQHKQSIARGLRRAAVAGGHLGSGVRRK
ncbi:MAG: hypothetical protein J6X06_05660 [Elusimicrobiaceae bacterium]|nr:hypothetical protein [Elusimicrobiaceae bacterium]